uniref:Uncharacterized protein n=1 Tax=Rhizophora mucronata TaxID=61149 RepID=A0A2P2N2X1_RHIMU
MLNNFNTGRNILLRHIHQVILNQNSSSLGLFKLINFPLTLNHSFSFSD